MSAIAGQMVTSEDTISIFFYSYAVAFMCQTSCLSNFLNYGFPNVTNLASRDAEVYADVSCSRCKSYVCVGLHLSDPGYIRVSN